MYIPVKKYIYFIGIGGVGMSGIAEILHNLEYRIKGSNDVENVYTERLKSLGIEIFIEHEGHHVSHAQVIVVSSAISFDNPEIQMAKALHIPIIQRAEMLAELMRLKKSVAVAGSHGKTTITSLAGALLQAAGWDPTIVNGGIINAYNANMRIGEGEWIVVEADESDGSFNKLSPTISIVSNIDFEHADHYKDIEELKVAFELFVNKIPFYGLGILCADHPQVMSLKTSEKRIITYGFCESAHIRGVNVRLSPTGACFDVSITQNPFFSNQVIPFPSKIKDIFIPMVGRHNVLNSLSVVALAIEMEIGEDILKKTLAHFKGVKRRFTCVGVIDGVTIIDDYAHHPVEIQATIDAAKQTTKGRIIVVVQPHRYTRLQALFDDFVGCFDQADIVFFAPLYSAGESPIEGVNSEALYFKVRERKKRTQVFLTSKETLPQDLSNIVCPEDIILCLGAGSISSWAQELPKVLKVADFKNTRAI